MQRCFWLTVGITCCSEGVQGKSHFVTIVRDQIPSYWWDLLSDLMLLLFTFLPCTLFAWPFSGRHSQEGDAGINDSSVWSRCRFLASQNVSSLFSFFSSTETGALELFWQKPEWRIFHLLQIFFSHCLCDSKCNRLRTHEAFWRYFFLAFILEHHCKRRLT